MKEPGFYFVNPFCSAVSPAYDKAAAEAMKKAKEAETHSSASTPVVVSARRRVSLKTMTLDNGRQKVNDVLGNPIIIGAVVIWRVVDPTRAVFCVEDYPSFLSIQTDSTIRNIARLYPYDIFDEDEDAAASEKLGSDYRKPDAVTVIDRANYRDIVWPLPAEELLFVGRSTRVRLAALGIHTIGDLARTEERVLKLRLGKMGELLHAYANGLDNSPVLREGEYPPAKSVGNGTTTPRDMRSLEDAMPVVVSLCECVGARLRRMGMRAGVLTLELRSPELSWISHRRCLARHTDCDRELLETALGLLREAHEWPAPLRSLAVRAEGLIPSAAPEQLDLFSDRADLERQRRLDAAVDRLRGRFGSGAVQRGAVFADPEMAVPPAQEEFSFVRKLG